MKKAIWLGVVLFVVFSTAVFGAECDSLRLIRVKGDAVVSVPPDKAVITLGLESRQDKLEPAKHRVDSLMAAVNALAREYNIPEKDVRTERYVIIPANAKRTKHYVNATIVVTITDMNVVSPFVSRVVDAGVDEVRDVSFELADPLAVRIKVREKAAEACRLKAETIIKALGGSLGRIHSVIESGATNVLSPYADRSRRNVNVAAEMLMSSEDNTSNIAVGMIEEQATVEVAFEIAQ